MYTRIVLVETVKLLSIILLMQNQEVYSEPNVIDTSKPVLLSENVTICSKFLSQRLADFCDQVIKVAKRDTSPLLDLMMPKTHKPRRRPRPIKLSRRFRRQISDECCDKSCSIEQLISYCPPNAPIYIETN